MDVTTINGGNASVAPAPVAPPTGQPAQRGGGVDLRTPQPVQSYSDTPVDFPNGGRGGESYSYTNETLQRAIDAVNSSLEAQGQGRRLDIRFHEATNRRVVTVYNSETNDVVREIPPERVLDAHANMLEMVGLLVDTRG
jgi:uncharacterized FlaG/YvyC family protein